MSSLLRFLKPSYYVNEYWQMISRAHKDLKAGSAAPFFKGMLIVGLTGYTIEYTQVGRHHVAERQALIAEALKNQHH